MLETKLLIEMKSIFEINMDRRRMTDRKQKARD